MGEPRTWYLENGVVELGVLEVGGQLGPVRFHFEAGTFEPMHRAPWANEPEAADIPMLQHLQGDFFCAPFGANDMSATESRDHGLTANGRWRPLERSPERLVLELEDRVAGARVVKELMLRPGEPVVYQRHTLEGGEGELPLGHHAMLRAPRGERLLLSFSPFTWAGTPPAPVEGEPQRGRSLLEYPQEFESLERVALGSGEHVDLTEFPTLEASEEILMLATDPGVEIAWSAAVAPKSGWLWFALRPNRILRNTMLWLSNGGRHYPPFSGRHTRVLGIEEVTSFFHLGQKASSSPNELSRRGIPTVVRLLPDSPTVIEYAFGTVPVPSSFGRVESIQVEESRLTVTDEAERTVRTPFDGTFLGIDRLSDR